MLIRGLTFLILFAFTSGCATQTKTHFGSFPTALIDFELCPEELRTKYSDIDRFDGPYPQGFFFHSIYDLPPVEELKIKWGDPNNKRISWWNLKGPTFMTAMGIAFSFPAAITSGFAVFSVAAHPTSVYTWEKGHYSIDCVVNHPMAFNYAPHMEYWRWNYKGPDCKKITLTDAGNGQSSTRD